MQLTLEKKCKLYYTNDETHIPHCIMAKRDFGVGVAGVAVGALIGVTGMLSVGENILQAKLTEDVLSSGYSYVNKRAAMKALAPNELSTYIPIYTQVSEEEDDSDGAETIGDIISAESEAEVVEVHLNACETIDEVEPAVLSAIPEQAFITQTQVKDALAALKENCAPVTVDEEEEDGEQEHAAAEEEESNIYVFDCEKLEGTKRGLHCSAIKGAHKNPLHGLGPREDPYYYPKQDDPHEYPHVLEVEMVEEVVEEDEESEE